MSKRNIRLKDSPRRRNEIILKEKLEKAEGALEMALEHLGYVGADHDGFCNDKYGCNVYGDDLESEEE